LLITAKTELSQIYKASIQKQLETFAADINGIICFVCCGKGVECERVIDLTVKSMQICC